MAVLASTSDKREMFLTGLQPISEYQQWGKRHTHQDVSGDLLSVNGYVFRNGIGTHAYSSIDYNIDGQYRFIDGYIGIEWGANLNNKIEFNILGDGRLIYTSGVIQGLLDPIYLKVPIAGVSVLRLEVRDGGDGINNDHADWLNMKLIP